MKDLSIEEEKLIEEKEKTYSIEELESKIDKNFAQYRELCELICENLSKRGYSNRRLIFNENLLNNVKQYSATVPIYNQKNRVVLKEKSLSPCDFFGNFMSTAKYEDMKISIDCEIYCDREKFMGDEGIVLISERISLLVADFTKNVRDFQSSVENPSVSLHRVEDTRDYILLNKRVLSHRKLWELYDPNMLDFKKFESLNVEFFKYLDKILERIQGKNLFLVKRNFIVPHGASVFAFSDEKTFGNVPMDRILDLLGMSKQKIFDMFRKLLNLPQINQRTSPDETEKITNPNQTPSTNLAKSKVSLEDIFSLSKH